MTSLFDKKLAGSKAGAQGHLIGLYGFRVVIVQDGQNSSAVVELVMEQLWRNGVGFQARHNSSVNTKLVGRQNSSVNTKLVGRHNMA
jgi:hypothetical protein